MNVMWEDSARYQGSSAGPNISDLTLRVRHEDASALLPVIRPPNFSDMTADVPMDSIRLRVGNEAGAALRTVTLRDVLADVPSFLSDPGSWTAESRSLLADRDSHVLVSAQACFLPVPKGGSVEFDPVLFNYQTRPDDPAVLAIVATREGTSITAVDGRDREAAWGQTLFFNERGQRARFKGERRSDVEARGCSEGAADLEGANVVLLIQVPLQQRPPPTYEPSSILFCEEGVAVAGCAPDVEEAVITHGAVLGPFEEIAGHAIERDSRFPVRVTIQLYQATANGLLTDVEVARFHAQIARIYRDADYVGSLVLDPSEHRPTAHGSGPAPPGWWAAFWAQYEDRTGLSPEDTMQQLRELNGGELPVSGEDAVALLER